MFKGVLMIVALQKLAKEKYRYNESDSHRWDLSKTHKQERFVLFDSFIFFFIIQKYFGST